MDRVRLWVGRLEIAFGSRVMQAILMPKSRVILGLSELALISPRNFPFFRRIEWLGKSPCKKATSNAEMSHFEHIVSFRNKQPIAPFDVHKPNILNRPPRNARQESAHARNQQNILDTFQDRHTDLRKTLCGKQCQWLAVRSKQRQREAFPSEMK